MSLDTRSRFDRPARSLSPAPPPSVPAGAAGAAAILLLALLVAGACGKKGDPQPPPRIIPARTTDFVVWQRGAELQFTLTYPTTTPSGTPLAGIEALELWRMSRSLLPDSDDEALPEAAGEIVEEPAEPETSVPPPPPSPFLPQTLPELPPDIRPEAAIVDARELALLGAPLLRLEGDELAAATSGSQILLRVPLEATPAGEPEELLVFAVVTTSTRGLPSELSNLAKLAPRQPPPPPDALEATPSADGVEIAWQSAEDPPLGFRVYRRDAASRSYGTPIATPGPGARSHLDAVAAYGSRYVYSATVVGLDNPLVESALATEREIDYQDRYAPPAPSRLLALAEPGRVRLLWEPSDADDVAGYRVWRQSGGSGEFLELGAGPQFELEFVDTTVASGTRHAYFVTAADDSGNESPASNVVEVDVP